MHIIIKSEEKFYSFIANYYLNIVVTAHCRVPYKAKSSFARLPALHFAKPKTARKETFVVLSGLSSFLVDIVNKILDLNNRSVVYIRNLAAVLSAALMDYLVISDVNAHVIDLAAGTVKYKITRLSIR